MPKPQKPLPHIGRAIRNKLKARRMTCAEFARRLNVERTTVYGIFENETIDVYRLIRISEILGYDFFKDLNLGFGYNTSQSSDSPPILINVNLTAEERRKLLEIFANSKRRR